MWLSFAFPSLLVVLSITSCTGFNISIIDYDAIEINVGFSQTVVSNGYLSYPGPCTHSFSSNTVVNSFNNLSIERSVLSIVCSAASRSSPLASSLVLLLGVQLFCLSWSGRQLALLVLLLCAAFVVNVQGLFIPVTTNQRLLIFNDFFDLYDQIQNSISEMIILINNPALNGTKMTLSYDREKKWGLYFPVGQQDYIVIKEDLSKQTVMFPAGGCVSMPSEFFPLQGYSYIEGQQAVPAADCFAIYTKTLNTIVLCVKNQTLVYFRNNNYALLYHRSLSTLPVPDDQFCQSRKRDAFECRTDTREQKCECCTEVRLDMQQDVPTVNCPEFLPGTVPELICNLVTSCPGCDNVCISVGYCPK